MYHGAEHKAIHTLEAGYPLSVENARDQSILHPRCGTSFLLLVMVLTIIVFAALGRVHSGGGFCHGWRYSRWLQASAMN